jgi:hypothetical protein
MSLFNSLTSLFSPQTYATQPVKQQAIETAQQVSGNPFLNQNPDNAVYGKNRPVPGGYFAGYYNGQPNIVGQKLFIVI